MVSHGLLAWCIMEFYSVGLVFCNVSLVGEAVSGKKAGEAPNVAPNTVYAYTGKLRICDI